MPLGNEGAALNEETDDRKTRSLSQRVAFWMLCSVLWWFMGAQVWAADAEVSFRAGQFEVARVAFEKILTETSEDPVALYYLGRLTSEGAKSKAYFQRLLKTSPQHDLADDALFELAEVDFAQGLYLTARRNYRQLLGTYPGTNQTGMAHYRIGLTFLAIHQADSSMRAFEAVQATADEKAKSHARLGHLEALTQKGQTAEARRIASQWLLDGAGDSDRDVRVYISKMEPDDAIAAVTQSPPDVFWIQVAAFKNKDGALVLKERLEKKGFHVDLESQSNSSWTLVFVGPYAHKKTAENEASRIDSTEHVKSKVTER
jgi:tetratricopeptide (TPR) repeat protein